MEMMNIKHLRNKYNFENILNCLEISVFGRMECSSFTKLIGKLGQVGLCWIMSSLFWYTILYTAKQDPVNSSHISEQPYENRGYIYTCSWQTNHAVGRRCN